LVMAVFFFLSAVASGVWVYLVSTLVKTLLLGLAPIFITLVLFKPTARFFHSWVTQLINFSLQPILIFTFLAMYSVMIDIAINAVFDAGRNLVVCTWKTKFLIFDVDIWQFATLINES